LEKEHDVSIIDANAEDFVNLEKISAKYYSGLPLDKLEDKIRRVNPEVVGISVPFSVSQPVALQIALRIKQLNKDIPVIFGGSHPSSRPVETIWNESVDFVVIGEGELTTLELLRNLESGGSLSDVRGIAYRKGGIPTVTASRPFIRNLDSLPFPARRLLPMKNYFEAAKSGRGVRRSYTFNERWTSMITSRGCPYQCVFCSIHTTMGRNFRARTPENVVEEIEDVIRVYGIRHINLEDDNMTLDRKRFKAICELIIERELDITWSAPNGIRADTLDEEMLEKMRKSGCKRVFVAPESGVQSVVTNIIGKALDLRKVEEAVVLLSKHGIIVDGSFVIGFIGESKRDIYRTIRFAKRLKRLGMRDAGIHIATPYYGTKLYADALRKGHLRKDLNESMMSTNEATISTSEWSLAELKRLRETASWVIHVPTKRKIRSLMYDARARRFSQVFEKIRVLLRSL
jgi:magnesium-protoporphyrin IX monomethyl ester (oxidative) cyclase